MRSNNDNSGSVALLVIENVLHRFVLFFSFAWTFNFCSKKYAEVLQMYVSHECLRDSGVRLKICQLFERPITSMTAVKFDKISYKSMTFLTKSNYIWQKRTATTKIVTPRSLRIGDFLDIVGRTE